MWDVFIFRVSEDKDNLVRILVKHLSEVYKVQVWYDEFTLEYRHSLLDSIEKGLQDSTFELWYLVRNSLKKYGQAMSIKV